MDKLYRVNFAAWGNEVYVLAEDWGEAIEKALGYRKHSIEAASILTEDGSLRNKNEEVKVTVKSVELVTEIVVK